MDCSPHNHLKRFRRSQFEDLPRNAFGVYGFWYGTRCIYVGKAANQPIKERLKQHWTDAKNPRLREWFEAKGREICFAYKVITEKKEIDAVERLYIKRFQPLTNVIRYRNSK